MNVVKGLLFGSVFVGLLMGVAYKLLMGARSTWVSLVIFVVYVICGMFFCMMTTWLFGGMS